MSKKSSTPRTRPATPSRATLAAHIAAIMAHPLTPHRLYSAIGELICDEGSDYITQIQDTAPYIEKVLARGGCGYIRCPGKPESVCPGPLAHKKGGAR
jgi:hypothetical protein